MNIIDSSGWLEYFADGPNANFFAKPILKKSVQIIIPAIIIYEIFKKILIEKGEDVALQTIGQIKKYKIIPLDDDMALSAAKLSFDLKLPMADSIIYAAAKKYKAVVWTMDEHFKKLSGVKYIFSKIRSS